MPAYSIEKRIEKIVSLIDLGADMWLDAGRLLVEMKLEKPNVFDDIMEINPDLTLEMLETLEDIGNKKLHPRTLLLPARLAGAVAQLPYRDQALVVANTPIPVRRGHHNNVFKPVRDMTERECKRAFSPQGLIPIQRQKPDTFSKESDLGIFELEWRDGVLVARPATKTAFGARPMPVTLRQGKR